MNYSNENIDVCTVQCTIKLVYYTIITGILNNTRTINITSIGTFFYEMPS